MLTASAHNKEQDFDAFFLEHHHLVYRAAYSVTHSPEDAEDVLQIVFMKVLRRDDLTEIASNVKGYLYRAAVHEALKILRTRARHSIADEVGESDVPAESTESPLENGMRESLLDAIATLKPEEVEILILRYQHGYTDEDIATMLGCSRIQIAVSLHRARSQLKRLLGATSTAANRGRRRKGVGGQLSIEGELR